MNRSLLMREYVSVQIPGYPVDNLSTEQLARLIDGYYSGGLDAWSTDYTGRAYMSTEQTQIRLRAHYRDITGRVLPSCHVVIAIEHDADTSRTVVSLECAQITDGVTRQRVTARALRMSVFYGRNETERIEIPDPEFTEEILCGQYTAVNTPERYRDKINQYLECYRPGTSRSPMDGCLHESRHSETIQLDMTLRELV